MAKGIKDLEAELKQRDEHIAELREEINEAEELVGRMEEQVKDADALIETWIEGFEMSPDPEDGIYRPHFDETHDELHEKYVALVRRWNKFVGDYNAVVVPKARGQGRPLHASEAQVAEVLRLRKAGKSLRWIAEELTLSLSTVRTIVGKADGTDRTSKRQEMRRLELNRHDVAAYRARRRTRDGLGKRITAVLKEGRELLKAAKGLGR
jgi:DNA-binding NarL/FixJ family response regulator